MLLRILYLLSFPSGILIHAALSFLGFNLSNGTAIVLVFGMLATTAGYVQWFTLTPKLFKAYSQRKSSVKDQIVE